MAQKKTTVITLQNVENGYIARLSSQQHVFTSLKELLDFIGEQYTPKEEFPEPQK